MSGSGPSGPPVCHLLTFPKSSFLKNYFWNTIKVSNSLYPDPARHYIGPGLIWVQIVWDGYQRTTLVKKELKQTLDLPVKCQSQLSSNC